MALFNRKPRAPETQEYAQSPYTMPMWTPALYGATWSGPNVDDWSAVGLPAFWRGLNLLCDHVATTPFHAIRNREMLDPQPSLLVDPTPGETAYDVWFQLTWSLVLRGNAFAYLTDFDRLGYPRSMLVLNPDAVAVVLDSDGNVTYSVLGETVPNEYVLHIRGPRPAGSVVGVGVIQAQREAIAHAIALNEYSARYFGDSAIPSGVIEVPGILSDEGAARLRTEWQVAHGHRHRYPAVLSDSMKFQPITATPEDQQLLEARRFSLMEIALMLGIPPRWLGADSTAFTYANLEAENAQLVQFGLRPWTSRIEAALTNLLPRPQFVKANFDALLRSDTKTRYDAHAVGLSAGFLTVDEVRELEDRPPMPKTAAPVSNEPKEPPNGNINVSG